MKWTVGEIERKVVWKDGLFTLSIRAPEVQHYEPGQFLQLGIQLPAEHLHRPYSVASPHGEILDFFIVRVDDGQLTPRLWTMDPGDELEVSQRAAGSFTLANCPAAETLWLIATGTGLAPYVAMLRTDQPWERYHRVVVVHGVRFRDDLAYKEELVQFESQNPGRFHYVPIISRENTPDSLPGRITNCVANGSLEATVGQNFTSECCVMLCGNPDMLDETEELLCERGLKKHRRKDPGHIIVERYW